MRGLLDGAGTAAGIDFRECEYFVGTSAGSIVASFLAAGRPPDSGAEARAARDWAEAADATNGDRRGRLAGLGPFGAAAAAPFAPIALASASPPRRGRSRRGAQGRAAHEALDARPGAARRRGRRPLRRAAADRRRRPPQRPPGRVRRARCPAHAVGQAVLASCAVPWIFAPVKIGGREYVDGGVWSPTNLDATPARRGTEVLCLNPTASLPSSRSAFGALRAFSRSAAMTETLALRARGATVRTIAPDARAAEIMGVNLMNRSRADEVLAAGYAQGRALAA